MSARYTKYYPRAVELDRNPRFPSTYCARFIGWDTLKQGSESHEATLAADVYMPMSAEDFTVFSKLEPGEYICRGVVVYGRD